MNTDVRTKIGRNVTRTIDLDMGIGADGIPLCSTPFDRPVHLPPPAPSPIGWRLMSARIPARWDGGRRRNLASWKAACARYISADFKLQDSISIARRAYRNVESSAMCPLGLSTRAPEKTSSLSMSTFMPEPPWIHIGKRRQA